MGGHEEVRACLCTISGRNVHQPGMHGEGVRGAGTQLSSDKARQGRARLEEPNNKGICLIMNRYQTQKTP